jgi:thymidylate synthase
MTALRMVLNLISNNKHKDYNMILGTKLRVSDIRKAFTEIEPDENGLLEIANATFIADEDSIFGTVNHDWNKRELQWYLSKSLSVNDIPAPIPAIWQSVASTDGYINSNYGWCIYSADNGYQYDKAVATLLSDKSSRQAVMIYNRPSMHVDSKHNGMKDFMCTNTVQLLIRNNTLYYLVYMRSNDAVYGYKGDYAWHKHVYQQAYRDLLFNHPDLQQGPIVWNAASLHVYSRHAQLVHEYRAAHS